MILVDFILTRELKNVISILQNPFLFQKNLTFSFRVLLCSFTVLFFYQMADFTLITGFPLNITISLIVVESEEKFLFFDDLNSSANVVTSKKNNFAPFNKCEHM